MFTAAMDHSGDSTPVDASAWFPLKNISDPHVTEIANYAVDAYTRQNQKHLIFRKVIKGYYQIESGTLYKLVIRVKDENVHFPTAEYLASLVKGVCLKKN
ncbi:hypothetical protein ACLB2K_059100 [Fragaria x ananassa]